MGGRKCSHYTALLEYTGTIPKYSILVCIAVPVLASPEHEHHRGHLPGGRHGFPHVLCEGWLASESRGDCMSSGCIRGGVVNAFQGQSVELQERAHDKCG